MLEMKIIGQIGSDAQTNTVNQNQVAINFSVAHTEKWVDRSGQKQELTTWVRCTIFREPNKASIAGLLKRGTRVYCSGKPKVSIWTPDGGATQASLELTVRDVELLSSQQQSAQPAAAPSGYQEHHPDSPAQDTRHYINRSHEQPAPQPSFTPSDDDLPF